MQVYALRICFSADANLPHSRYLGSAWRGAFGHALKRLVCIFKQQSSCEECALHATCAYPLFYETAMVLDEKAPASDVTAPFTLYPECSGSNCYLYVTLFGSQAMQQFPFVLHALREAGAHGVAKAVFTFESVQQFEQGAWHDLTAQPKAIDACPAFAGKAVKIRMLTPLRFKYQGHLITADKISLPIWLNALKRRIRSVDACWGGDGLRANGDTEMRVDSDWQDAHWQWQTVKRYSKRQHTEMNMDGLLGHFTLTEAQAEALWPVLWLGQWLHLGKASSMGLGRYTIEVLEVGV